MSFLLPFIYAFSLFAAGTEEKRFDFDKNGKSDFIEVYRDGKLSETHYDSDADGKFDRHTILDPDSEVFKIVELEKTKSQPRKRISFTNNELRKLTIAHVELDKNNDGVFEISYEMSTDIHQKRETCAVTPANTAERLSENVLAACMRTEDYTQTDFGYRVHKSCTEGARSYIMPLIRESISEGLACLTRLSQEGMRGAARNLSSLESILSNNNVQILCNETGYDWTGTAAHATTGNERARQQLPLVHPGISMGPVMFSGPRTRFTDKYFKSTLFHEQLHNLGHRHGVEPEISYTCATCCFPENNAAATEAACKVCGGDYSSVTDPEYLRDITAFGEASHMRDQGQQATIAYLKENIGSTLGLSYLSVNAGGVFGPVGTELARSLSNQADMNDEEASLVGNSLKYFEYAPQEPYRPGGRVVAEAYMKLFRDGDARATLRYLQANAPLLRQQMALRSGDNGEYMAKNIKENLDKIIFEVWINNFRGSRPQGRSSDPISIQAYDVKNLLGL